MASVNNHQSHAPWPIATGAGPPDGGSSWYGSLPEVKLSASIVLLCFLSLVVLYGAINLKHAKVVGHYLLPSWPFTFSPLQLSNVTFTPSLTPPISSTTSGDATKPGPTSSTAPGSSMMVSTAYDPPPPSQRDSNIKHFP
jgi:hypothetical protein